MRRRNNSYRRPRRADFFGTINLTGAQERPIISPAGTGVGSFVYNTAANSLTVNLRTQNLTSNISAAHIHLVALTNPDPTAVTGPVVFGLDTGLDFTNSATASTFPQRVFTGITPVQLQQLQTGYAYFNVHTVNNPGGETRGNFPVSVAVPKPGALVLLGAGGVSPVLGFVSRRHRRRKN